MIRTPPSATLYYKVLVTIAVRTMLSISTDEAFLRKEVLPKGYEDLLDPVLLSLTMDELIRLESGYYILTKKGLELISPHMTAALGKTLGWF